MLPLPLRTPCRVAPKRAFRSSTNVAGGVLVMLSTWLTLCPTCTVPKFSGWR